DQRASVRLGHVEDAAGMGGEVERFATGFRDGTHQRLRHRRHTLAFLVAELGEAESGAGIENRVLNSPKAVELFRRSTISRFPRNTMWACSPPRVSNVVTL